MLTDCRLKNYYSITVETGVVMYTFPLIHFRFSAYSFLVISSPITTCIIHQLETRFYYLPLMLLLQLIFSIILLLFLLLIFIVCRNICDESGKLKRLCRSTNIYWYFIELGHIHSIADRTTSISIC